MDVHDDTTAPFLFVGGALVLDFINSEIVERGKRRDLLQTPADLMQWWYLAAAEHGTVAPLPSLEANQEVLQGIRKFRAVLRRFFETLAEQGTVEESGLSTINNVLQQGYQGLRFTSDTGFQPAYHSDNPLAQWCLPLALSAAELLTTYDPTRLHKCHNDRCILLFYDTTKSGTRQWCSLACLERERSSRRYQERKAVKPDQQNEEA